MRVSFFEISNPEVVYKGELTETIKGEGFNAVKVRDLRIQFYEDTDHRFKSLLLRQVVTLVIDRRPIDFYKSISNGSEHLLTTHP